MELSKLDKKIKGTKMRRSQFGGFTFRIGLYIIEILTINKLPRGLYINKLRRKWLNTQRQVFKLEI